MKYHNHEALSRCGVDPCPRHGDTVEWVENGETWTVCKRDDLEGQSALHHWPDGGWCNVNLVARGGIRLAPLVAMSSTLAAVTAERDRLAKACAIYRMVAESAQDQWGDDCLWEKWGYDDDMRAALAELEKNK